MLCLESTVSYLLLQERLQIQQSIAGPEALLVSCCGTQSSACCLQDLKSANILLTRDGTAKIADVGLAKIMSRELTQVSARGSFDWVAPEVLATPSPPLLHL